MVILTDPLIHIWSVSLTHTQIHTHPPSYPHSHTRSFSGLLASDLLFLCLERLSLAPLTSSATRPPPASLHSPQPIPLPLGGPSLREAPLEGVKELGVVWPYLYPGGGLVPSPLPPKTWSSEDVGYTGQTEQMDKLKRGKIQVRRLHSTWALLGRRADLRVPP